MTTSHFRLLRASPALAHLDDELLGQVDAVSRPRTLKAGEVLIREGEIGADIYFVRSGRFAVTTRTPDGEVSTIATRGAGAVLGEGQLIAGGRRTATVRATEPSELLALDGRALDGLLARSEPLRRHLTEVIGRRLRSQALRTALVDAVGDDPDLVALLAARAEWVPLDPGEVLIEVGDPGDCWFVLVSGELSVHRGPADGPEIGFVRRGEVFGEVALIRSATRGATLAARRRSWVARFDTGSFEEVLQRPESVRTLLRTLADRLVDPSQNPGPAGQVFVLVVRDETVDAADFAARLAVALGPSTVVADRETIAAEGVFGGDHQLPREHPAWLRFDSWMELRRQDSSFVLLLADPSTPTWHAHVIGHADVLLLLADADADPAATDVERTLAQGSEDPWSAPLWLALQHPAGRALPSGTERWLNPRDVAHHAHVRAGNDRDMRRLARWLAGRRVGIALSGGGARGLVHMGVLQALDDLGVEVDLIAGTSAGSMAAGLLARDEPASELTRKAVEAIQEQGNPFAKLALPLIALLREDRLRDGLQATFGEALIEDSWIPLRIVATDLSGARRIVFDRGLVWHRAFASSSPPGAMPPVIDDDRLLCDGGLVDNLPVSVLVEEGCTVRLASNVASVSQLPAPRKGIPNPWTLLLDKVFRRRQHRDVPTLLRTLLRTVTVPAAAQLEAARRDVHLMFEPDVAHFSVADFGRADEMLAEGESHARRVLEAWPGLDRVRVGPTGSE